MNKKLLIITLISLSASVLVADHDHFDRISLAIKSSDVVRTKSLVRQLDDLELSTAEKKKALHTFVKQATEVVESHPSLHIVKSFRDTWNTVVGAFGISGLSQQVLAAALWSKDDVQKEHVEASAEPANTAPKKAIKALNLATLKYTLDNFTFVKLNKIACLAIGIPWTYYQFKKGFECYHQRSDYDKALRIETWLKEQKDNLS